MYLSKLTISGFRQFGLGPNAVSLPLKPGVTALIGKNDSGKTAIIDAIRYALLSRDQMYIRVQPEDFHVDENGGTVDDINITCILSDLSVSDQAAFAEYLTFQDGKIEVVLPAIARALNLDLEEHGVSIVNVKGTGLKRFSKIFQRADEAETWISMPVSCLADMDIMPDAAPEILGLVNDNDDPIWKSSKRRWKAKKDLGPDALAISTALLERVEQLTSNDAQNVKTFVSDHWTLEYDLARCGLADMVFEAALLANAHDKICAGKTTEEVVIAQATKLFDALKAASGNDAELIAIKVYWHFKSKKASKAIAAQYLAMAIDKDAIKVGFDAPTFKACLPTYVVNAIQHACGHEPLAAIADGDGLEPQVATE